jgi:hypothetical protein
LVSIFGREPDPAEDGFVGYVERGDTRETVLRDRKSHYSMVWRLNVSP